LVLYSIQYFFVCTIVPKTSCQKKGNVFIARKKSRETYPLHCILTQGRWLKISSREGNGKKQDRKIAPLSLPLLYQYHVWKSRGATVPSFPHLSTGMYWQAAVVIRKWIIKTDLQLSSALFKYHCVSNIVTSITLSHVHISPACSISQILYSVRKSPKRKNLTISMFRRLQLHFPHRASLKWDLACCAHSPPPLIRHWVTMC